ncbi:MAG: hypothetical protein ACI8SR_002943 [Oceanicoccus sp.]|jgi:hypothetical protein
MPIHKLRTYLIYNVYGPWDPSLALVIYFYGYYFGLVMTIAAI